MRDQYLASGDFNIISVDWAKLAGPSPFYFTCAENAKRVGAYVGEFIEFMVAELGAEIKSFHPIGFSLGGQLVGFIGKRLEGQLSRITGLDPAG